MANALPANRGEIWLADLNPVRGHEQAGCRPVLVVSVDAFNQSLADLAVIIPITSTLRPIPFHFVIQPPEGGLTNPSALLCEAVRSISKDRLLARWGTVAPATIVQVEDRLRILLGL
jgi:mRNA interferase MazF